MGALRWLNRIDPTIWDQAIEVFTPLPASAEDAEKILNRFGREVRKELIEPYQLSQEELADSAAYQDWFEATVSEQTWEFDKSFRLFEKIPKYLPALKPLNGIFLFDDLTIDTPSSIVEDSGLLGCISSSRVKEIAISLNSFSDLSVVRDQLSAYKPNFLSKLFGADKAAQRLSQDLDDPYFYDHWVSLISAIEITAENNCQLGLGLSV